MKKKFKNNTMSDTDLRKKGKKYVANKKFKKLSTKQKRKGVVLNLDEKGAGTHWVGIKEKKKGVVRYFDSYGIRPSYGIVKNSLILYNPKQLQKFSETNCGQRVIKWLNNKKK